MSEHNPKLASTSKPSAIVPTVTEVLVQGYVEQREYHRKILEVIDSEMSDTGKLMLIGILSERALST